MGGGLHSGQWTGESILALLNQIPMPPCVFSETGFGLSPCALTPNTHTQIMKASLQAPADVELKEAPSLIHTRAQAWMLSH